MNDTKKFRQAFLDAGFRPSGQDPVFNDKHTSGETRRLKLRYGDGVFAAPQFAQEELDRQFEKKFGHRYLGGQFIAAHPRIAEKSFCIYLLTE